MAHASPPDPRRRAFPPACDRQNGDTDSADAVRPDYVTRGRKLLQDPTYPPPAVLQAVARRLSRKFQ